MVFGEGCGIRFAEILCGKGRELAIDWIFVDVCVVTDVWRQVLMSWVSEPTGQAV